MTGVRGPVPCALPVTPRPGDRVMVGNAENSLKQTLVPLGPALMERSRPAEIPFHESNPTNWNVRALNLREPIGTKPRRRAAPDSAVCQVNDRKLGSQTRQKGC
jgi:hypothetical protein